MKKVASFGFHKGLTTIATGASWMSNRRTRYYSKRGLEDAILSHQRSAHAGKYVKGCGACRDLKGKLAAAKE